MKSKASLTPESLIRDCVRILSKGLALRWKAWTQDAAAIEVHDVVGCLLSRQVTLAREIGFNPGTWTPHLAPVLLRVMIDVHITLAWILCKPAERSRAYIEYGLGQEKLEIEHLKNRAATDGAAPELKGMVEAREEWLASQRFPWLTEVNVGAMGDASTRQIAQAADCMDIYRYEYQPCCASVHSSWHYVERFNSRICGNPLHRPHRVPDQPSFEIQVDVFLRAARYVEESFALFDEKTRTNVRWSSAADVFEAGLTKLAGTGAREPVPKKRSKRRS